MDGNNKQKVFPLAEDNITIYGVVDDWVYYSEGTAREVKRSARNGSKTENVLDALHENITVSPSVVFCKLLPDGDIPGGFSYIITQQQKNSPLLQTQQEGVLYGQNLRHRPFPSP